MKLSVLSLTEQHESQLIQSELTQPKEKSMLASAEDRLQLLFTGLGPLQRSLCYLQAWLPSSRDSSLQAAPHLNYAQPCFKELHQKSCQAPLPSTSSMPGKVFCTGSIQVIQCLSALSSSAHPRSHLKDEQLSQVAEALYIPVYDTTAISPANGPTAVLEAFISAHSPQALISADLLSYASIILSRLHISISSPWPPQLHHNLQRRQQQQQCCLPFASAMPQQQQQQQQQQQCCFPTASAMPQQQQQYYPMPFDMPLQHEKAYPTPASAVFAILQQQQQHGHNPTLAHSMPWQQQLCGTLEQEPLQSVGGEPDDLQPPQQLQHMELDLDFQHLHLLQHPHQHQQVHAVYEPQHLQAPQHQQQMELDPQQLPQGKHQQQQQHHALGTPHSTSSSSSDNTCSLPVLSPPPQQLMISQPLTINVPPTGPAHCNGSAVTCTDSQPAFSNVTTIGLVPGPPQKNLAQPGLVAQGAAACALTSPHTAGSMPMCVHEAAATGTPAVFGALSVPARASIAYGAHNNMSCAQGPCNTSSACPTFELMPELRLRCKTSTVQQPHHTYWTGGAPRSPVLLQSAFGGGVPHPSSVVSSGAYHPSSVSAYGMSQPSSASSCGTAQLSGVNCGEAQGSTGSYDVNKPGSVSTHGVSQPSSAGCGTHQTSNAINGMCLSDGSGSSARFDVWGDIGCRSEQEGLEAEGEELPLKVRKMAPLGLKRVKSMHTVAGTVGHTAAGYIGKHKFVPEQLPEEDSEPVDNNFCDKGELASCWDGCSVSDYDYGMYGYARGELESGSGICGVGRHFQRNSFAPCFPYIPVANHSKRCA